MSGSARNGTASAVASVLLAAAGAAFSGSVVAQEFGVLGRRSADGESPAYVGVKTRVERTDNVHRVTNGKESDTLASAGLDINYGFTGARSSAVAVGDISYVKYLDDSFGSQLAGIFDGEIMWGLPTDMLQWEVRDTFGQTRSSALAAATPDNLQNVNVLTTGPTLNFLFGETQLSFDGRYAVQSYESSSNLDAKRLQGGASIGRAVTAAGRLSLNAQVDRVKYDDTTVNADFDTRQYFVRYDTQFGRTNFSSDLGYTEVEIDGVEDKTGGSLVRVDIDRQITTNSSAYLGGRMQFSSVADALRSDRGLLASQPSSGAPLTTSDPFREQELHGGWRAARPRTTFVAQVTHSQYRYEQSIQLDRDASHLQLQVARHIAPTLWLKGDLRFQTEKFVNIAAKADEVIVAAELSKSLGRRTNLSVRYEYTDHSGKGGAANYKENAIQLYVDFLAFGRR